MFEKYFKQRKLNKAFSQGWDLMPNTYDVDSDLYSEWKKGKEYRENSVKYDKEHIYNNLLKFKVIDRDVFDKSVTKLGTRLDALKQLLYLMIEYKDRGYTSREIQIGAPLYMPDYDSEVNFLNEFGITVKKVRHGFGAYTRSCLDISWK